MNSKEDISDKIIAAAADPNISESEMRVLMLIISEYAGGDSLLEQTIHLPTQRSAKQLNISITEYEADIKALEKHGLITIHDSLEHIALN